MPGHVVVLDNLPAHKVDGLAELAFSKLKTWLRSAQARTRDALEAGIRTATRWVSKADAENRFDHCGYHV